ncbi:MAG: NADH-quinone oxidoreductase subunit N [Actinomycetota bacterium]|nr:NADH-quinone oxidoreductase subunit N [Actinomycetota bacterium]
MNFGLFGTIAQGSVIQFPSISYKSIGPELVLVVGSLIIMVVTSLFPAMRRREVVTFMSSSVAAIALIDSIVLWSQFRSHGAYRAIAGSITLDGFSVFMMVTISSAALLGSLAAGSYLTKSNVGVVEFQSLLLLASSGGMILASAGDLIVIFVGLEVLSIALYVLAAFEKRNSRSGEAGLKYFILGGFSSAIFLYGIALTYGATGSTNISKIAGYLAANTITNNGVLLAGIALLIVGFAFKVAAVPFHLWTPDVYQGSPSVSTGYMAAAAKAAGFAGLLRVLVTAFPTLSNQWRPILWVLAGLTMVFGAALALIQKDVKRMLAYSSINHAGFVMLGVAAGSSSGTSASLYYLISYTFVIIATFAIISVFEDPEVGGVKLTDLRGLFERSPFIAFALAIFLVAQAGAPLTTGLIAKFSVVAATVSAHSYVLAVIAMLSAVVAAFFYLRIVATVFSKSVNQEVETGYFSDSDDSVVGEPSSVAVASTVVVDSKLKIDSLTYVVVVVSLLFTVGFGIFAAPLSQMANQAHLLF